MIVRDIMKKLIFILLTAILLSSCASAYKPSDNLTKISASMTREEALSVFHSALDESKTDINVCDLNIISDEKPVPTDFGFKIKSYKRGEKIGVKY